MNRGISLDANPVMQSRLLKEIHCYDVNKYELQLRAFSENQQDAIRKFWNRYTPDIDIKWLQFYYTKSKKFDLRYIPHDVYYSEIDRILNPPYRALGLDDKRLYKRLFPGVKQPHILLSKIGRMIINDQGAILDLEKAMMECFHFSKVVCKEPINSCGGHSVECLYLPKDDDRLYELLTGEKDIIIQECITQHKELAAFHSCSVNTIRLITYLRENGECIVLSSVLRMGNNGSFVDNVSSGGCTCGIKEDGSLKTIGYSNDMRQIDRHPQGVIFKGRLIQGYDVIIQLSKKLHTMFPFFATLAWDFTIDENGNPNLIEVNMNNASIDFMQLNNGPLFGDYTDEILERVYRKKIIRN